MDSYHFNIKSHQWEQSTELPVSNRAFLYGDGFFDTMLLIEGVPGFWSYHKRRIEETFKYLELEPTFELDNLIALLHEVIHPLQQGNGRLRLSFFRSGDGKYLPREIGVECIASFEPYKEEIFPFRTPEQIGLSELVMPSGDLGNYKLIGRHLQIKGALEARAKGFAELLFCNEKGNLVEAISSNVFLVNKNRISTPPLNSGALAGVIRQVIIDHFDIISDSTITINDLNVADEIFTTNSVMGLKSWKLKRESEGEIANEMRLKLRELQLSSILDFQESLP